MLFEGYIKDFWAMMPWNVRKEAKAKLRALSEQHRRILTKEEIRTYSDAIIERIEATEWFKKAHNVMLYYPIRGEVDLMPLFERYKEEKNFILPVTHRHYIEPRKIESIEGLKKGHFGIPEPQTGTFTEPLDLILVPGVVFDTKGHRIGRGGGYYDRFLRLRNKTLRIGVCYGFQLKHQHIPVQRHDVQMNAVISPDQTIVM